MVFGRLALGWLRVWVVWFVDLVAFLFGLCLASVCLFLCLFGWLLFVFLFVLLFCFILFVLCCVVVVCFCVCLLVSFCFVCLRGGLPALSFCQTL